MKAITDQYEFEERALTPEECRSIGEDPGLREILSVRCRWCSQVILSNDELCAFGRVFNVQQAIGAALVKLTLFGGLHLLVCRAPRGN